MNKKPLSVALQHIAPQRLITWIYGQLAESRVNWFKNWGIRHFIKRYQVDMRAALLEKPEQYETFNLFFTRKLKPQLRPIVFGNNEIACPVDGCISQLGKIQQAQIFQAKGFYFTLNALLGGDMQSAQLFNDGFFATFYLSPKDYHRVHMPLTGQLRKTIYVPGKLFSVNRETVRAVPDLFANNERLVCLFDTAIGPMAVILVGAMIVGNIETVWEKNIKTTTLTEKIYTDKDAITLNRGDELGLFKLGSTAIVLFPKDKITWSSHLKEDSFVKMGQLIGIT